MKIKTQKNYKENKDKALAYVIERLNHYNKFYSFMFNNIRIKNHTSRWGSCSSKGNLNFNYKIVFLADEQADYIIVQELCHLGEFNHSYKFWDLVAKSIPNWKEIRKSLHGIR